MGLYSRYIFPRILEFVMSRPEMTAERPRALADAAGEVLEIGFGTGLNLPHYPQGVERLTILDPAELLPRKVSARIAAAPMQIDKAHLDAARLPFDSGRFDCVVSTWTLCSIDDVDAALTEIRRVLRPGGKLLFVEHGRSDEPHVAGRQDRWNPLWRRLAGGCNMNRPILDLIRAADLQIDRVDAFPLAKAPRILAPTFLGAATKT